MGVEDKLLEVSLNGELPAWIVEDLRKAAEATLDGAKFVGKKVGQGAEAAYDAASLKLKTEFRGYKSDIRHIGRLEFDKVRPETELLIAKSLRDVYAPDDPGAAKGVGVNIPIPIGKLDLPGDLSVRIWAKDVTDLSKGKAQGVMLNYELYRF
jgi:hypothetical protein